MSTWQDVKRYIYSNYQVSSESDDGVLLTLVFNTSLGRSQMVHLVSAPGANYMAIGSPIGPANEIDANHLLDISESSGNKDMGIRKVGDFYMVVAVVMLEDLNGPELEVPMRWATIEADQYEQALGRGDRY